MIIIKACLRVPSPLRGSFDLLDEPSDGQNGRGTILPISLSPLAQL